MARSVSGESFSENKYKKARFGRILSLFLVAVVFFALGNSSQGLNLPKFLGGGNSKVRVSKEIDVNVEEIYSKLKDRFDGELTNEKVGEGIKRGLISATNDPYTTYFTKDQYEEFEKTLNGSFSGIGAEIGKNGEQIVVIAPIDGSPAAKSGLKAGDAILQIDGTSTEGISVEEAVTKIRGDAGTKVKLSVVSAGERKDIEVTREDIKIASVKSEQLSSDVGYIKISQFGLDTASLTSRAASELKAKGVNKIILDLRNNGGGYVDQAVSVAGIWLDQKTVLSERFRGAEIDVKRTASNPTLPIGEGNKLIVLVNEGSASASEILAAALRDNAGVKLIGTKTFGKGSVQEVVELSDESRLKITIAHWFTPKGQSIDKSGIDPDVKVEVGADSSRDLQKEKAIELLQN